MAVSIASLIIFLFCRQYGRLCSVVEQLFLTVIYENVFFPSSPSSKSSNSPVTVSPSSVIAPQIPSVASVLSLSSFNCFSILLAISSSIRQPSNSTTSFNSMSLKRPFTGVFEPSVTMLLSIIRFFYNLGTYFTYLQLPLFS